MGEAQRFSGFNPLSITNVGLRAFPSVGAKLCKMEKVTDFTHFEQKNNHISGCKVMHKCTIAIVTVHIAIVIVHICTVTIACEFNI